MEKPESYFDWEKTFKKKKAAKVKELESVKLINSIGLPHDFFKSYLKRWKSHNIAKDKLG